MKTKTVKLVLGVLVVWVSIEGWSHMRYDRASRTMAEWHGLTIESEGEYFHSPASLLGIYEETKQGSTSLEMNNGFLPSTQVQYLDADLDGQPEELRVRIESTSAVELVYQVSALQELYLTRIILNGNCKYIVTDDGGLTCGKSLEN